MERRRTKRDVFREIAQRIDSTLSGFNGFTSNTDPVYYTQNKESKEKPRDL